MRISVCQYGLQNSQTSLLGLTKPHLYMIPGVCEDMCLTFSCYQISGWQDKEKTLKKDRSDSCHRLDKSLNCHLPKDTPSFSVVMMLESVWHVRSSDMALVTVKTFTPVTCIKASLCHVSLLFCVIFFLYMLPVINNLSKQIPLRSTHLSLRRLERVSHVFFHCTVQLEFSEYTACVAVVSMLPHCIAARGHVQILSFDRKYLYVWSSLCSNLCFPLCRRPEISSLSKISA